MSMSTFAVDDLVPGSVNGTLPPASARSMIVFHTGAARVAPKIER